MKRRTSALLAILLLAGLLMACGAAATPNLSRSTPMPGEPTMVTVDEVQADYFEAPAAGHKDTDGSGYTGLANPNSQIERMVIHTAEMVIIVEDVETSLPSVNAMVQEMGGYIVQASSYRTSTDRLAATVTLRIPAERFDEALSRLRALAGKVQSETLSGQDVTDQYVDLQSRLKALQATETELLALLTEVRQSPGNAQEKAQAILDIYNRLTEVRSQIEQIQGQMNYLSQLSDMGTITVQLLPREAEIMQPVVEEGFNPLRTLSQAARALLQVLQWLLNALIWFVVAVLPILVVVALPVLLVVWLIRRRRKSKAA